MAEPVVQTVKCLLRSDPDMALLTYHSTSLEHSYSPAELLFRRFLCSLVPVTCDQHRPAVPVDFHERFDDSKQCQTKTFNTHHNARDLPALPPGTPVYLPD